MHGHVEHGPEPLQLVPVLLDPFLVCLDQIERVLAVQREPDVDERRVVEDLCHDVAQDGAGVAQDMDVGSALVGGH